MYDAILNHILVITNLSLRHMALKITLLKFYYLQAIFTIYFHVISSVLSVCAPCIYVHIWHLFKQIQFVLDLKTTLPSFLVLDACRLLASDKQREYSI